MQRIIPIVIFLLASLLLSDESFVSASPLDELGQKESQVESRGEKEDRELTPREKRRRRKAARSAAPQRVFFEVVEREKEKLSPLVEKRLKKEDLTEGLELNSSEDLTRRWMRWMLELPNESSGDELLEAGTHESSDGGGHALLKGSVFYEMVMKDGEALVEEELIVNQKMEQADFPDEAQAQKSKTLVTLRPRKGGLAPTFKMGPRYEEKFLDSDPLWMTRIECTDEQTGLRLRCIEDDGGRLKPAFVQISTQHGFISDDDHMWSIWLKAGDPIKLGRNHSYKIEVDAGYEYRKKTLYIYTNSQYRSMDIELEKWCDLRATPFKPIHYYSEIKPFDNGVRWDTRFYKLTHEVSGLSGWAIAHPIKIWLNRPVPQITLPYDAFWELSRAMHSKGRLWIPVQPFVIDDIRINVLGAFGEINSPVGKNRMDGIFKLIHEAHAKGGLVSYGHLKGQIKSGEYKFSPLEMLLYSGADVDLLEVNDHEEEEVYYRLLKNGVQIPMIRSSASTLGASQPVANLMLKLGKEKSLSSVLNALGSGQVVSGQGAVVEFELRKNEKQSFGFGDFVHAGKDGLVLTPEVNFLLNPDFGLLKELELIVNGQSMQKTRVSAAIAQGRAVFGSIRFFDGDSCLLKMVKKNGDSILSNPIFIGREKRKPFRQFKKVPVHIVILNDEQGHSEPVSLMIRGKKFFREKSVKNGKVFMELPLDANIEFWSESIFKKVSLFEEVTKSLLILKAQSEDGQEILWNEIQDLFPYRLSVTLNAP